MKKLKTLANNRIGVYKKELKDENILEEINDNLLLIEEKFVKKYNKKNNYKDIFVVGAPRSGTTLCTQMLASIFDLGFISNNVARFYKTPLVGLWLDFQTLRKKRSIISFQSDFARTKGENGIHEFGYFWREYLKIESYLDIIKRGKLSANIQSLFIHLNSIRSFVNSSMVYKNIYGSYIASEFIENNPENYWVYIERDIIDASLSILEARKKHYGEINNWWSYYPFEYNEIKDFEPKKQIFYQVYYLQKYYNELAKKYPTRVIKIKYENLLCAKLDEEIAIISNKIDLKINNQNLNEFKNSLYIKKKDKMLEERVFFEKLKSQII